ncbi:potassium transporter [Bacteroides salyersiae]|jgi:K+ uptake protein|uniref:TrkH family potassium uptake protein n=1 Tax=Bacteroides salyersiae TaxID=291644 RepID=UPI001C38A283|nr:potassium transporter TrkG [Bacteroides salyersiae]MBV4204136.1 potassium transporter [Bacteroides salyersiae]MCB6649291.1 potassium transporter [Bacteroides salyersiae]MCS2958816.1 potassium transporter [Bacteroides salyersiae]UBD14523.1 potassium transporter [Bacteroides salyersiae]
MKIYHKILLYQNKLLQPYVRILLRMMAVLTYMSSLLLIVGVVYEHGFPLSATDISHLKILYKAVWIIFLIDVTLHIFLEYKGTKKNFRKLAWILSWLLYLTLVPVIFHRPDEEGAILYVWDFLGSKLYHIPLLLLFSFLNLSNGLVRLLGRRTNPSLILAVSFFVIILIGTGLLLLPRCTVEGVVLSWVDALFTSTSAVCVTGLVPVDVSATFTPMGLTVIILLIQVGGLGVMTLTSFFAMFFMGNTSLYNQLVVRDMVSSNSLGSLLSTLLYILGFTMVIEGAGMVSIWLGIHGTLGMSLEEELAFSAFHSISAFCNAGFSTLPGNLGNPMVMTGHNSLYISVSLLIILGGIGFPILVNFKDIVLYHLRRFWKFVRTLKLDRHKKQHLYNLNTKIVLIVTLLLLVLGTLAVAAFEWNGSFAGMSVADKWTQAFFNATCPRTAGFSSVDLTSLSVQTILIYIFLMWIGGAAQSTAGGVKVNAFAVVVLNLIAVLRGTERVEVFGRELSHDSIRRSNATVVMSLGVLFLFIFVLSILEPKMSVMTLTFECVSALSTVGSSLNATPLLRDESKLLVALLMFVGRVGLITLMLGIVKQKKNTKYRYPSDDIIIN